MCVFPKASQVENWNETEWIHNISSVGKCWLNIQQFFSYIKLHKLDAIMHSTHNIIQYLAPVFSISFYYPPPPHPPPGQSFVMKVDENNFGSRIFLIFKKIIKNQVRKKPKWGEGSSEQIDPQLLGVCLLTPSLSWNSVENINLRT